MVVKLKEPFEKTKHIKNNDKDKKLHFTRTKKYKISRKNYYNFVNFL